jgi:hypothetical protein
MIASAVEFVLGFVLAAMTLRDVFYTVVVPGSTRGLLKVSRRLVRLALPLWKHIRHRGIGVNFAPIVLAGSFITWWRRRAPLTACPIASTSARRARIFDRLQDALGPLVIPLRVPGR